MNENDAKLLAQDERSLPEELAPLLGKYEEVDRLLVRHPKRAEIERIVRANAAAGDVLSGLSLAYHQANLERMLRGFAAQSGQALAERLVARYLAAVRPFSGPTFHVQDLNDPSQRTRDLIGGLPYTSEAFPWPLTQGSGRPMQPIVQVDLASAGKNLGVELGGDLLQAWGPVYASAKECSSALGKHGTEVLKLRLLPRDRLADPLVAVYQNWSTLDDGKTRAEYLMVFEDDDPCATQHLISWNPPLPMYGSPQHLFDLAWGLRADDRSLDDDELSELVDGLVDACDDSPLVPTSWRTYLGGYGGQSGGEYDPSYYPSSHDGGLLVRISDGGGFYFAVKYSVDGRARVEFEAAFTIRA